MDNKEGSRSDFSTYSLSNNSYEDNNILYEVDKEGNNYNSNRDTISKINVLNSNLNDFHNSSNSNNNSDINDINLNEIGLKETEISDIETHNNYWDEENMNYDVNNMKNDKNIKENKIKNIDMEETLIMHNKDIIPINTMPISPKISNSLTSMNMSYIDKSNRNSIPHESLKKSSTNYNIQNNNINYPCKQPYNCFVNKEMINNTVSSPILNYPLNSLNYNKNNYNHFFDQANKMNSGTYTHAPLNNSNRFNDSNVLLNGENFIIPYDYYNYYCTSFIPSYPYYNFRNTIDNKHYYETHTMNELNNKSMESFDDSNKMYYNFNKFIYTPKLYFNDNINNIYQADVVPNALNCADNLSNNTLMQKNLLPYNTNDYNNLSHQNTDDLNNRSSLNNNNTQIFNYYNYVSSNNFNIQRYLSNNSQNSNDDYQQNLSLYNTINSNCYSSGSKTYFYNQFLNNYHLIPSSSDIYNTDNINIPPNNLLSYQSNTNVNTQDVKKNKDLKNESNNQNINKKVLPNKKNNYNKDIYSSPIVFSGNIYKIAKDQTGCRILQRILEKNNRQYIDEIYNEVLYHIIELMVDPFGNYLCQKLMEVCTPEQIEKIIDKSSDELINASISVHGTRTVQKLIEVIKTPSQIKKTTDALKNSITTLIKDINGNHVVQKCLIELSSNQCNFIYEAILNNCVEVSTHRHGCCVIQRCIDSANEAQRELFIKHISNNVLDLVQDAFGNYVVQYILNLGNEKVNLEIANKLLPNIEKLAIQKFSSNVIEKCLILDSNKCRKIMINEILKKDTDVLKNIILDPFGNYVIQRALSVSIEPELSKLVERIKPYIKELHNLSSGKRIAWKLAKKHPLLSIDIDNQYLANDNILNNYVNKNDIANNNAQNLFVKNSDNFKNGKKKKL